MTMHSPPSAPLISAGLGWQTTACTSCGGTADERLIRLDDQLPREEATCLRCRLSSREPAA